MDLCDDSGDMKFFVCLVLMCLLFGGKFSFFLVVRWVFFLFWVFDVGDDLFFLNFCSF